MVLQDPRDIAETVKKTLETQGTLSKIRAQLRAHVITVLDNELSKPTVARSNDGTLFSKLIQGISLLHSSKKVIKNHVIKPELKAIDAIYECLAYLKLTSTLSVFEAETKQVGHSLPEVNIYKKPAILSWIENEGILIRVIHKSRPLPFYS